VHSNVKLGDDGICHLQGKIVMFRQYRFHAFKKKRNLALNIYDILVRLSFLEFKMHLTILCII
jgi:hypothetical protein